MKLSETIIKKITKEQTWNEDTIISLLCRFIDNNKMQGKLQAFLYEIVEDVETPEMKSEVYKERLQQLMSNHGLSPNFEAMGEDKVVIYDGIVDEEPCFLSNLDGWVTLDCLQEDDFYENFPDVESMKGHNPNFTPKCIPFSEAKQIHENWIKELAKIE